MRDGIDAALRAALDEMCGAARMVEACRYAVLGAGKRLRPALVLQSCRAAGGTEQAALPAAVAVEFVHAFSLVHDDLPSMDDDDLRRGRPTLHIAMGEATALLAGDLLLCEALAHLVRHTPDPQLAAGLVHELTDATARMISGQSWDTTGQLPAGLDDLGRLRLIHEHKTGALIRASCRMGGLWAGADAGAMQTLTQYGDILGLLFQITDDILDAEGSVEQTGKRTRKDAAAGKLTYPGVLGLPAAHREARRLCDEACAAAGALARGEGLAALARMVGDRSR
ncbi:MAG: polyprenyl synthetase family protein [Phycisphaerales bacterium JB039]